MRRPDKTKATGSEPAAFGKRHNIRVDSNRRPRLPQRFAFNWLLDSATYIHDGDSDRAKLAALRGLRAITRRRRSC